MKKVFSKSVRHTRAFAKELANKLEPHKKQAVIIGLQGHLGAGKTTFIKAFARAFGYKGRVTSPTFLILRSFRLPKSAVFGKLIHIDAYRVDAAELKQLGFTDIIKNPKNILVVEWADRVKKIMPRGTAWIKIEHGEKQHERIIHHRR
ncbi:MAG: tRNA (adenosine(37)-N6)-threonylcarbamoyltransferase complex ATPase subunit type 1 TsaE [Candidatus Colwellbacteria bacterium]|nr:tRNA (adenosine(37)-N6)-threonylcarbamoyltransferase complex ATPase subunit type 1 TsaE [Candidatus Colwellbacteria bacterium]